MSVCSNYYDDKLKELEDLFIKRVILLVKLDGYKKRIEELTSYLSSEDVEKVYSWIDKIQELIEEGFNVD